MSALDELAELLAADLAETLCMCPACTEERMREVARLVSEVNG